jgi:hypothetical protein
METCQAEQSEHGGGSLPPVAVLFYLLEGHREPVGVAMLELVQLHYLGETF